MFIEVPNCGTPYYWGGDQPHISFYAVKSLVNICKLSGFEVVACFIGGPSANRYIVPPTVRSAIMGALSVVLVDSSLLDSWLRGLMGLYRGIRSLGATQRAIDSLSELDKMVQRDFRDDFFAESDEGYYIRAYLKKAG